MSEERVERRLAAILAGDVVGYSRLMGADEVGTLRALKAIRRELADPTVARHHGRVVKTTGDGILIEFPSVVDAITCAISIQRAMANRNAYVPEDKRIVFRIGVNVGDIIIDEGDIYGDGVNVAARLETICEPGGVCISRAARDQIRDKLIFPFVDLGEQTVKNIARLVRAFGISAQMIAALPDEDPPISIALTEPVVAEPKPRLDLPDKPSIAVLPFQNMSADPEQEYFADGIVEEIITALSRFRQLFVIARNSTFTYKDKAVDVKQVGRELGVRYVLEGSVRKSGTRLRITGQLIDASSGAHLWADRFDGDLHDIFELQDQITTNVVGAIAPKLEQVEIERANRKTDNLDAYDCFLRGMASYHQYIDRQENALRLFERAIELDADFASAYAMAGHCYVIRKASGWRTEPDRENAEAIKLARRAMELAKDDALALAVSGGTLAHIARDLSAGFDLTDRALSLNPNLSVAWFTRGWLKIWFGEHSSALESIERAMRLSPLDPYMARMQNGMAHANFYLGRYDQAVSWAAMAIRELPNFHDILRINAATNAVAGRLEQAREAMGRLRRLDPALRVSQLRDINGPYRRAEDITRYEDAMRMAGLPE
jgi:adenylate cyclase